MLEGKKIDYAIIDEFCKEAMGGVAEAMKELAKQLNPFMDSVAELIEQYNNANKPPQGRDAFRGFVESKQKMNRRYRR